MTGEDACELVRGAWDAHVHAAPSLFPRWGDGWDLAEAAAAAGMAGVVLKAHHGCTVASAALLDRRFGALAVRGGVVLNAFVGGISPLAAERSLALGARVVWMPTIHAAHHGEVIGQLGGFSFQSRALRHTPRRGLRAVDETGALRPEVREVLALVDEAGAVLGTGHLGVDEIRALRDAVVGEFPRVRLLVNHALFSVPALTVEALRALEHDRVSFELCYLSLTEMTRAATAAGMARALGALPRARWILASDSGQEGNPPAPACLARFARALAAEGVAAERLARMLRDEPRALFG